MTKVLCVLLLMNVIWTIMDMNLLRKIHEEKFLKDVEKHVENVEKN